MIARPRLAADEHLHLEPARLPEADGLAASADRVRGWGGDVARYTALLARAVSEVGREHARDLAGIAAWRSGIPRLRADALARAAVTPGAAIALGLETGELEPFLAAQRDDPFALPGARSVIGYVGGFRGLGGPWLSRPNETLTTGAHTTAVRTAEGWWAIEGDVFGVGIRPLPDPPRSAAARVVARSSRESYLVLLERVG